MPRFCYSVQKIIDRLSWELDEIEKFWPMILNYQRIEPYVVPYIQMGHQFELIIFHNESQSWFSAASTDSILTIIKNNNIVKPNDVVFDLGCNSGAMSIPLASLCEGSGHVHAFDPYPWNAAATKANAMLNGLGNITTYNVGLSNRDYSINVRSNDSRIFLEDNSSTSQKLVIHDIRRYRNLKPTFMKIDIEGSEHDLFQDRDTELLPSILSFVLEFHPFFIRPRGLDPAESLKSIEDSGFSLHFGNPNAAQFDISKFNDNLHLFWCKRPIVQ